MLVSVLILFAINLIAQNYIDAKDYTTVISADVSIEPAPKVILNWEKKQFAVGYYLFKKKCIDLTFPTMPLIQLDSLTLSYTDNDVKAGECYEYELWIPSMAKYTNGSQGLISGYAYTTVGLQMAEPTFGTCLILVDSTMKEPLAIEIERLANDLKNEGCNTIIKSAPRAEKFDKDKVKATKNLIINEYNANKDITTVLLIGRIPVPYSGNFQAVQGQNYPPDGHPEHVPAWPADMYYGSLTDYIWTDVSVNIANVQGQREENKNIPGDGKFDLTVLGNNIIHLSIGRIDLFNMKAFHKTEWTNPELELLKRYLNKNHEYRNGLIDVKRRGLVAESESFTAKNLIEGFGSSGWRNFYSWFGNNVEKNSYFATLKTDFYMGSYATGPGSYTSAGGIGATSDFAAAPVNTIFTMLFGSYFGDWDVANSFLRAPLCSEGAALTSGWAARPHWYLHKMTMGYPIGTNVLMTQNNSTTYKPLSIYDGTSQRWQIYAVGVKNIHVALMGDPTLTLYPKSIISEPRNLSAIELSNFDIELNWDAPENSTNTKYAVYRKKGTGKFELITPTPISLTSFVDDVKYDGILEYQVKAIELINTHTGSFFRTGRAISASVTTTDVAESDYSFNLTAGPIPAQRQITFKLDLPDNGNTKLEIFSLNGDLISELFNNNVSSGIFTINWNLTDKNQHRVNNGIYFAKLSSSFGVKVIKLIVD